VVTATFRHCPVTYGYAVLRRGRPPPAKSVVEIEDEVELR
jgi:hypothetical protein